MHNEVWGYTEILPFTLQIRPFEIIKCVLICLYNHLTFNKNCGYFALTKSPDWLKFIGRRSKNQSAAILGDPGAVSGGGEISKRAKKIRANEKKIWANSSPEFFSRPFRLFRAPTNCPWVSEDDQLQGRKYICSPLGAICGPHSSCFQEGGFLFAAYIDNNIPLFFTHSLSFQILRLCERLCVCLSSKSQFTTILA